MYVVDFMKLSEQSSKELGLRLESIFMRVHDAQLSKRYDCVWDCCCDHGYLGTKMLLHKLHGQFLFVDQVPHITDRLLSRLGELDVDNYQVITADAGELNFISDKNHLVIIAGVTGTNVQTIIDDILTNNSAVAIDFMVCATRGNFEVRSYLQAKGFYLLDEILVTEKKRHYEIIHVTVLKEAGRELSDVGEMWDLQNPDHLHYLQGRIRHFERESQGEVRNDDGVQQNAKRALLSYQSLMDGFLDKGSQ